LSDISDDVLREGMRAAGRILGATSRPFNITPLDLVKPYYSLYEGANNYKATPEPEKRHHKEILLEALAMVEFQASWVVLRDFFGDGKIDDMGNPERISHFFDKLYSNSNNYPFFNAREMAIIALSDVDVIKCEEYGMANKVTLPN